MNASASTVSDNSLYNNESIQSSGFGGKVESIIDEAHELAEEHKIAMRIYPHALGSNLLDSGSDNNLEPTGSIKDKESAQKLDAPNLYDTLAWYPGLARIERLRKAYMNAHPQVRTTPADGDAIPMPSSE